ncbi:MAG TPA: YggS family pyridoxal phosphate-dependent enzyme [Polyangiaceae bacterium]|nr:YggS family pyridoxal phosphate-dependent enzyme [Polyangiaceae bacterium]
MSDSVHTPGAPDDAGSSVQRGLANVHERIATAAARCGRDPATVRLLAVSKRQSEQKIREAYAAGQRDFGESYAQELVGKSSLAAELTGLRFHMIGHVQRNKCGALAGLVSAVHSVDSVRLARELGRRAALAPVPAERRLLLGAELAVFVEVNLGSEAQKAGCSPAELPSVLAAVEDEPALALIGLMAIPEGEGEAEASRRAFQALAELRERQGGARRLPELSMGMSRDLEVAVECGTSWVRVGTDIFGARARA